MKFHGQYRFITPSWDKPISQSEIADRRQWHNVQPENVISDIPGDKAQVFRVATDQGNLIFKRYRPNSRFRYFLRQGRASREWQGLNAFNKAQIPVPELVAHGEDRRWGTLICEYIVTKEIEGAQDLASFASAHWFPQKNHQRTKTVEKISQLLFSMVKRAHHLDLYHQDLQWRNILIKHENQQFALWLIDCPRFRSGKLNRQHHELVDLSCISRVARSVFSKSVRFRLLLEYFNGNRAKTRYYFRAINSHHNHSKHPPRRFDLGTGCYGEPFSKVP